MKLLFLLPDFFFRNTFYEYRWIADAIINGLSGNEFSDFGFQAKLFCGEQLKQLILEDSPNAECFFIEIPTLGILNQKDSFPATNWSIMWSEKIWNWTTDFSNRSFYSTRQYKLLDAIYKKYSFSHVIHWGNNVPVASWCVERDIKSYFVEMGFMRKPSIESLVIDSCGVNSLSSIAKSEEKDFSLEIDFNIQILQESIYEAHNKNYSYHCRSSLCFDAPNVFETYNGLGLNSLEECNLSANPKVQKFGIFLQLADDTQIIGGSGFRSMHEYLKYIIPEIKSMHGDDSEIYVRFHPGSLNPASRPLNILDAHKCRKFINNLPNVFELDIKQSWHEQVLYFKSIFTINSSIAFEAWLFSPSLQVIVSGIPGWYPSAHLYKTFTKLGGSIHKFHHLLDNKTLKGVALYSLGGYLYRWNKNGQSLIGCVLHRILCETLALSAPHLRFGVPGPGTREIMERASITSHTLIHNLFTQNFKPQSVTGEKLTILNFLSNQSLRFFYDIYNWSENSFLPFSIFYSKAKSSLILQERNEEIDEEILACKSATLFVARSDYRILCKRIIRMAEISSSQHEIAIATSQLDICEAQYLYAYVFLHPFYNSSSDQGSFKIVLKSSN